MPNLVPFYIYQCYLEGVTPRELAAEFDLAVDEIELRIEAARLCLEHQVDLIVTLPA